jgi:hypothetical protein
MTQTSAELSQKAAGFMLAAANAAKKEIKNQTVPKTNVTKTSVTKTSVTKTTTSKNR